MLFSFFDAVDWGAARLTDYVNFLRSIPSFFAPKPSTSGVPYTPPFTGGQQEGIWYFLNGGFVIQNDDGSILVDYGVSYGGQFRGAIKRIFTQVVNGSIGAYIEDSRGIYQIFGGAGGKTKGYLYSLSLTPTNGSTDTTNLPNPNPAPAINDDGLFTPNNPVIGDENGTLNPAAIVLSPAAPLILIGGGLALAAAAAAAAQAATDALAAIKKVAEALDSLKKLWEKLKEFLEEWEKDRPKNRDIVRQTYGSIDGDGAIDFYPLNNKNFTAIQVDIVVTEIPIGFGKYFGSMSPSRYRYKELGYISFYSISKGIIETHSIQFKRSSLIIPKTAVGFIYHFGLDNKIKGFAFGTFSVRKT